MAGLDLKVGSTLHETFNKPRSDRALSLAAINGGVLGCFGAFTTAAATNPGAVNPCTLITQAEAQSALGMPVKPGVFMDSGDRFCSFKPTNGGTAYVTLGLSTVDKAGFDVRGDDNNFERVGGPEFDAFFDKTSLILEVWHAGNELQVQIHFGDNASRAGVKAADLKLATIAVTRF